MKGFLGGLVVAFVLDLPPMDRAGVIVLGTLAGGLTWFMGRAMRQVRWPDDKP